MARSGGLNANIAECLVPVNADISEIQTLTHGRQSDL
jgi:hypothetical protein